MSWLFGTDLIAAVQSALGLGLAWLFLFFTLLGEDIFYIGLIASLYWCVHKREGVTVAYLMLFGFYLNYFLKASFRMDRPPDAYRIIDKGDLSHGFPSGHTQSATTFWVWASLKTRLKILYILTPFLIFMIGFSRIYLGVHYPGDVIGGFVVGLVFVLLVYFSLPRITASLQRLPSLAKQLLVPAIALVLFAVSVLIFPDTVSDDPSAVCGGLFGFSVGVALEAKYVVFSTDKISNKKRVVRLIVGLLIVGVLYVGLSLVLPSSNLLARFGKYSVITFAAAFIVPLVFHYLETRRSD